MKTTHSTYFTTTSPLVSVLFVPSLHSYYFSTKFLCVDEGVDGSVDEGVDRSVDDGADRCTDECVHGDVDVKCE